MRKSIISEEAKQAIVDMLAKNDGRGVVRSYRVCSRAMDAERPADVWRRYWVLYTTAVEGDAMATIAVEARRLTSLGRPFELSLWVHSDGGFMIRMVITGTVIEEKNKTT